MNSSFENNSSTTSATNTPQKKLGTGPKTRVCYVCGRQYGIHSFEIHLKQCKELWIAREAEKDPRDRKKLPEDPMLRLSMNEANENMIGTISSSSKNNSSTMNNKTLDELNRLATVTFNNEAMETCKYCLRTFLTQEKLIIHNRSCTVDKPARKITDSVNRRPNYINNNNSSSSNNILYDSNIADINVSTTAIQTMMSTSSIKTSRNTLTPSKLTRANTTTMNSSQRRFSYNNNLTNTHIVDNNAVNNDGFIDHTTVLQQQHLNDRNNLSSPSNHPYTLSGNAGRSLRKSISPPIIPDTNTIFNIDNHDNINNNLDNINTKEEMLIYLVKEIDRMEKLSLHLVQSIANMKQIINKLE